MEIKISTRHKDISRETKQYAEEKAQKMEKYYKLKRVEVIMEVEGDKYKVEMVASPADKGSAVLATATSEEWFGAVDQVSDKLERQLRRMKEKVKSHRVKKHTPEAKTSPSEKDSSEKEDTYDDVVDKWN